MFLRKFWVSFVLTVPIVAYSDLFEGIFGTIFAVRFVGSEYISPVLGTVVFFYGGWTFLIGARHELRRRLPGMMTLIAMAIISAYFWSMYAVFFGGHTLFWELSTLITIMLLGHYLEMRAVQGARGALKELAKLLPDTAELVTSDKKQETRIVKLEELKTGDVVLVRPGGKIPADGKITEGQSELDESIVTGESKLISKNFGDEVIAGTINGDGSLKIEVTKIGENTFLAGVMRLVAEAQASKSRLQILSDKAALILTIIAVIVGISTLIAWLFAGADIAFAVARLVAVLVIACPHALGLAVPLIASISTNMAASSGFFIKQRKSLESARNIDVVLFDKTGTLTEGAFGVISFSSREALALAASVDFYSEHPIAKAIVAEAKKIGIELKEAKNYKRIQGAGGEAEVDGKKIFVGHRGGESIQVEREGEKIGVISVADKIRPEAKEALKKIKDMGIRAAMITGDSEDVARQVAGELGIDEYFSRVLPDQKLEKVRILQNRGLKVAMVGDGVNDAPALTQADLGIAIGAGTNVAIESAGIILVKNDPRDISRIIKLSRLTYSKMLQNIFWASGYNIVAIPLAAGVLAPQGIILQPAVGAIFMSLSTVIVAVNAMLMRRKKI